MKSDVPVLSRHTAEDTAEELGIDRYEFFKFLFKVKTGFFLESDQKNDILQRNIQ